MGRLSTATLTDVRTNLIAARVAQNLTQTDVGRVLGVTQGAVGQWERGEAAPRARHLIQLADLLGITPAACLDESPDAPLAPDLTPPPTT